MKTKNLSKWYFFADYITAAIAWALFFILRKLVIEPTSLNSGQQLYNIKLFWGIILIPLFWLFIYYITGFYRNFLRKRIDNVLLHSFLSILAGSVIIFFLFILDDTVGNYKNYYLSFFILFFTYFAFTIIPRLYFTHKTIHSIQKKEIFFNTLIIGAGIEAYTIYKELENQPISSGNNFIGYIPLNSNINELFKEKLQNLGTLEMLPDIVRKNKIDEVIIAIEPDEHKDIFEIISWLRLVYVTVKATPGMHSIIKGSEGISNILGTPLIEINQELMPVWQQQVKQVIDIVVSFTAIVILTPLYIICTLGIKLTSKGPVLFKQERIGRFGKPFTLYKFRSMYIDAEKDGPNLATKNDNRLTSFGKLLRSTKLDEIPNFFNVLNGDMSLVGPRPERRFYIEKIIQISPNYQQLQKIKPGITSLGQVKYGYAENVEQMTKRLRYDILYVENMSLYTDFKILFYTILLLFKGRHI
jgi:exopolysaccharide biosynthesis polyprenyl glycosylphosphotransferase